jgi:hypothetical protein
VGSADDTGVLRFAQDDGKNKQKLKTNNGKNEQQQKKQKLKTNDKRNRQQQKQTRTKTNIDNNTQETQGQRAVPAGRAWAAGAEEIKKQRANHPALS